MSENTHINFTAYNGSYYINGVEKLTLTLIKGETYTFDGSAVYPEHPIRLSSDSTALVDLPANLNQYTSGYSLGNNNINVFTVPNNAPEKLYYYCNNHAGMGGIINIIDSTENSQTSEVIIDSSFESTGMMSSESEPDTVSIPNQEISNPSSINPADEADECNILLYLTLEQFKDNLLYQKLI